MCISMCISICICVCDESGTLYVYVGSGIRTSWYKLLTLSYCSILDLLCTYVCVCACVYMYLDGVGCTSSAMKQWAYPRCIMRARAVIVCCVVSSLKSRLRAVYATAARTKHNNALLVLHPVVHLCIVCWSCFKHKHTVSMIIAESESCKQTAAWISGEGINFFAYLHGVVFWFEWGYDMCVMCSGIICFYFGRWVLADNKCMVRVVKLEHSILYVLYLVICLRNVFVRLCVYIRYNTGVVRPFLF